MSNLTPFGQPRLHETPSGLTGIIAELKIMSAGPTIFHSVKKDGDGNEYRSLTLVGQVSDLNDNNRKLNASLAHLRNSSYAKVILRNAEGDIVTDIPKDAPFAPVTRSNGEEIEGVNQIVGYTAEVTITADAPVECLVLETENGVAIYTHLDRAPAATKADFAALMAMVNNTVANAAAPSMAPSKG